MKVVSQIRIRPSSSSLILFAAFTFCDSLPNSSIHQYIRHTSSTSRHCVHHKMFESIDVDGHAVITRKVTEVMKSCIRCSFYPATATSQPFPISPPRPRHRFLLYVDSFSHVHKIVHFFGELPIHLSRHPSPSLLP